MDVFSELDKLYLPSQWVKRCKPEEICDKHRDICLKASEEARKAIPNELNVPYGKLGKEKFDIFGTDLKNDAPIFVFFHGGYWQEENFTREVYHFIAVNLHKKGVKSIFVGYELCPAVTLPQIVQEVKISLKKCIEYATEKGSSGLYLAGYSAGAHLIACLLENFLSAEDTSLIKGLFLISGIYDIVEIVKTSINLPLKLDEKGATELSPLRKPVRPFSGDVYVIVAGDDSPIFKEQAGKLNEKYLNAGLKSTLHVYAGVDHFDISERLLDENYKLSKLIEKVTTGKE